MTKRKTIKPDRARTIRVNIKGNVYSYEYAKIKVKEKKENADSTDKRTD